jgi:hypothetical protein
MPEEMEIPIEQVHEHIHHSAHHSEEQWVGMVALSTAILAGLAAIASLLSGLNANDSIRQTVKASDQWAYYQSKNNKATMLQVQADMMSAMKLPIPRAVSDGIKSELKKKNAIYDEASKLGTEADEKFKRHETLAPSVTLFQVAVAVSAIAVLTKRRWFWYLSLVFGLIALGYLIYGETFKYTPEPEKKEEGAKKPVATAALHPGGEQAAGRIVSV